MTGPALALSTVEFAVVWRAGSYGALPLVIDVPSPGATPAERAELERRVWTDLEHRDLADDHGHPHWRLSDLLTVIAHRRTSLQLRTFGRDARNAILATRGRATVLAELDDAVRLRRAPETGRASTILSLLPPERPGAGYSVSVPTATFTEAAQAPDPLPVLHRAGLPPDDARTLLAMTTGTIRVTQLTAEHHHRDGHVTRSPVLAIHDTLAGRYRTIQTDDHLTVTPATPNALHAAVEQLHPV
ncbi:MAG TPA: ESX secretion-associated protein EspG [Actinophytocola sp.]|nr:ESX secretion-associated protein EspG [Actinophytocola sp.]